MCFCFTFMWMLASAFVAHLMFVSLATATCSTTMNGTLYDLSPLTYDPSGAPPSGYQYTSPQAGDTYYINFCAEVSNFVSPDCNKDSPSGSCQLSGQFYFPSGEVSSMDFVPYVADGTYTEGVGIKYSNGDYCANYATNRNTVIFVSCDPNSQQNELYSESSSGCDYTLYFKSSNGCPVTLSPTPTPTPSFTSSPTSTPTPTYTPTTTPLAIQTESPDECGTSGWIIAITFFSGLFVGFLVAGAGFAFFIAYQKKRGTYQQMT